MFPIVAAVHAAQTLVVARLHRQMQMGHQMLKLAVGRDQLVGQILGMARHEADARNLQPVEAIEQIGELRAAAAIGVDVLSQQRDLLHARVPQAQRLLEHGLRLAGALPAADIGHDAVGAEVVAAVHDVHEGAEAALARLGQTLDDLAVGLNHLHHRRAVAQYADNIWHVPHK